MKYKLTIWYRTRWGEKEFYNQEVEAPTLEEAKSIIKTNDKKAYKIEEQ